MAPVYTGDTSNLPNKNVSLVETVAYQTYSLTNDYAVKRCATRIGWLQRTPQYP